MNYRQLLFGRSFSATPIRKTSRRAFLPGALEKLRRPTTFGVEGKVWTKFLVKLKEGVETKTKLKSWAVMSQMSKALRYSQSRWQETGLGGAAENESAQQETRLKRGELITVVSWNLNCEKEEGWDPATRASTCLRLLRQSEFGTSLGTGHGPEREDRMVVMLQKVSPGAFGAIKSDPWVQRNFTIAGIPSPPDGSLAERHPEIAIRERSSRESDSYRTLMAIPRTLNIARCFRVYRGNASLTGQGVEYLVVDLPVDSRKSGDNGETIRLCTSFCDLPYDPGLKGSAHLFRRHVSDVSRILQHDPLRTLIGGMASVDFGLAQNSIPDREAMHEPETLYELVDRQRRLRQPVHYDIHVQGGRARGGGGTGTNTTPSLYAFIFGKYDESLVNCTDDERKFKKLGGDPRYSEEGQDGPVVPDWFLTSSSRLRSVSARISCKQAGLLRQQGFAGLLQGGNSTADRATLTARINEREENPWHPVHKYPGHVTFFRVPVD